MDSIVYIPNNFTDAGKLLGLFEIRNVAECAILCLPIALLAFLLSPFGLTATIIICVVLMIPLGGFALMGVHDYSLFTFARLYRRWRKNRRILIYRGSQWVNAKKKFKKKSV